MDYDDVLEFFFMKMVFPLLILGIIFGFIAIGCVIYQNHQETKCCNMYENRVVHQQAWTQWIMSGKTMIPINHPAGDYEKSVCISVKPNCQPDKVTQ